MRAVTIYTTSYCGYCVRAKSILTQQAVPYVDHDVTNDDAKRQWLVDTTGSRTVPQIFFGDEPIGGCDDLEALVRSGRLKERLATPPAP